jgi:TPR repeat protein
MALKLLRKASDEGILEAQHILGGTYLGLTRLPLPGATDEFDPAKLDPALTGDERLEKAGEYLEKAWKRQYPPAGMPLALALIIRDKAPSDLKQAVDILDAVSRLPSPDPVALRQLAWLFTDEDQPTLPSPKARRAAGVKPDPERVEQLMRQAASAGDEEARTWCRRHGVKY